MGGSTRMSSRNKAAQGPSVPILGVMTIELHFPDANSLKAKRMIVNSVRDRLRRRFNVAVAETGYLELWQRAELAAVTVASSRPIVESQLDAVDRELDEHFGSELVGTACEIIG